MACFTGCGKEEATVTVTDATCEELMIAATEGIELPGMMTYDPSMEETMLSEMTGTHEPDQIAKLPEMEIRHTGVCEKEEMAQAVLNTVK